MRSPVSGLCRLLGYAIEEILEYGMAGSGRQSPVGELDGIRVGRTPVSVCVWVCIALDAPDGVHRLRLRGVLRRVCYSVGFPSEFISPF